uniref:Retroelement n=1 Tax=Oryza sativa subsp. japonica TaxID=39947 RepID=Q8LME6_ORYSJ|nr:Putative retroelement [Oryza sativa Japonica Group]
MEFTSKVFNEYCMALGIKVEHSVPHVHTQNGLAESLIKRIKLIARPLLLHSNLPTTCWGHAVLHAAALLQIRPTAYNVVSPMQLTRGYAPNISHLRKFGCAVYVPIPPPKRTSMGPHRKLGIYVGFESPSIIKFLEPLTGDLHTGRYADCIFNEDHFPALGGGKYLQKVECREIEWETKNLLHLDPRTKESDQEVQTIIDLQRIANNLPEAFINPKGIMKSHIPAVNAPERVEIPHDAEEPVFKLISTSTPTSRKRGRPPVDEPPAVICPDGNEPSENARAITISTGRPEIPDLNIAGNNEDQECERIEEISTSYVDTGETYNRETTIVDIYFAEKIAKIIDLDPEPKSMAECKKRFRLGYKWVFVRKRDENNQVVRYKARLVAQGFTQRPGIDFDETYSPVMDGITFWFLISMAVNLNLEMQLMDVVTAYLYGSLDSEIYMKVPDGIQVPEETKRNIYSVKLQRSLYGLKQSGRMWYNRLSEFLEGKGFIKNDDCPCLFMKRSEHGFCIISVYVDDLNIIGTTQVIKEASSYLKTEFEMKELGKTTYCLGLQLEHTPEGVLLHQYAYIQKILEKFNMKDSYPTRTPMVVRSLAVESDPFRPQENNEELLGPECPYLSAIGALMYLANGTRPDIAFAVNLLARFSSAPTKRHWNGVKQIFRYLRGTQDLGLFFRKNQDLTMAGYADAGYLSDPHKALSQTRYVFLCGGTAISWKSTKQTMVATSTNHSEIIALFEASKECMWLRRVIQHVQNTCGLNITPTPIIIYEDNSACVAQIQMVYVKMSLTKHISPKFFYMHELQKKEEIKVTLTKTSENLADLFTKSLPTSVFEKLVHGIGMRRMRDVHKSGGALP